MMLRLYLSDHITISSISRKIYWSRFLQALLRYVLQHLVLYSFLYLELTIVFSSRRLALLLLGKLWRSRLMLRELRLGELVILNMLRMTGSLSLSPLSVNLLLHSFTSSRGANLLELKMIINTRHKKEKEQDVKEHTSATPVGTCSNMFSRMYC